MSAELLFCKLNYLLNK